MCMNPVDLIGNLFSPAKPTTAKPPQRSDAEVQAAALAERRRAALAAGRQSTILTGGQGDLAPVSEASKVLLGQ